MIFDIPVRLSGKLPPPDPRRRKFVIRVKTFGVECPACGHPSSLVTDSRRVDTGKKRRRECVACMARFTTLEQITYEN